MSIVIMIVLLGFLILVHEMGHFFAAKALGIKVSKFALGFPIGPTLWRKKIGDVEYLIHACILGGYVAFPDDDKDSPLPMDSPERFANNPIWKRMIVISAGVLTNLVVAFLLVFLTAGIWGQLPSGQADVFVGKIVADKDASVWKSGMQEKDKILTINGSEIKSNYALTVYAKNSAQYDGKVDENTVAENLSKLENLNPNIDSSSPIASGVVVKLPQNLREKAILIDEDVLKGLAFYQDNQRNLTDSQIRLRNRIKGKQVYIGDGTANLSEVAYAISDNYRPLYITVERNGKPVKLDVIHPDKDGLIGIMPESIAITIPTKNFKDIIENGSSYLYKQTMVQIYGLYQLLTGKIPTKEMHGIVAVAKIGADVIENGGMSSGLLLTAIISAWLAILNFLPIPALDGGHFMFLII